MDDLRVINGLSADNQWIDYRAPGAINGLIVGRLRTIHGLTIGRNQMYSRACCPDAGQFMA
jgi:hypothetical protein